MIEGLTATRLLREAAYIDGQWRTGSRQLPVVNPATGTALAQVPDLTPADADLAIEAAARAQRAWAAQTAGTRSAILRRWHDLMLANQEDLARIMTAEQGKPLAESRGEIAYAASFLAWFAEEGRRAYGEVIPPHRADHRIVTLRQPVGVVAAITPWNFPAAMVTRKVGPALAAGCTVVLKPAEQTPLSALALAVLAEEAGVPAGVFNVLTTRDAAGVGRALTASPIVRKLSFTGSTQTGKLLMQQCAATVKRLSLELGGNAPFIVFDDADVDAAVAGAIASKFRNAGQTCVCANRLLVQSGIHDAFVARFTAAVQALKVGDGAMAGTDIGPLIDGRALDKVETLVADALGQGARALTGGSKLQRAGTFFEPTVLTGVNAGMRVSSEEIFGPVAPVIRFAAEEEGVALANATSAGLAAYFYSRDLSRVWRVMEGLEYGMVGINTGLISTEVAPFGGVKESGIGREGSRHGLDEYLEIKMACMKV